MFEFPVGKTLDLARNNVESQFSRVLNVYRNFVNASMQLGELNVQASRKLMEESATAISKGMQVRTPADVQSFIAEQSKITLERISGYALNVQAIAAQNWDIPGKPGAALTAPSSGQPASVANAPAQNEAAPTGQHETNPHPSPLVEKLVAAAVNDIDKLH